MAEALPTPAEATHNALFQFVEDVLASESGNGIRVDAVSKMLTWPHRHAEGQYGDVRVGFNAEYSGEYPDDVQLGYVSFFADNGEASLRLNPYERPRIMRDYFAEAFLMRLRHEFVMHDHELCMSALQQRRTPLAAVKITPFQEGGDPVPADEIQPLQASDLIAPKKRYAPQTGVLLSLGKVAEIMTIQDALKGRRTA